MDQVGSVEIVIKGGRPWGFTLQGGIENRTALTVAQIEPRGKADQHGALKVGDHVLRINDVQCFSLADATQLIDCAFKTLTILVWRSKSVVGIACPQTRDCRKNGNSRPHRHSKDDRMVMKRTSTANTSTKVLPRPMTKANDVAKPEEFPPEIDPSRITLTCDSHQKALRNLEANDLKRLWSSGDRSPLPSNANLLLSKRSNSALSLASSINSQEDVFQTYEPPNRYARSPRNLTKDSGYETCAQAEHDYVNVEWINGPQVLNRSPLSPSLPPPPFGDYSGTLKSSSANKMPKSAREYFAKYPVIDNCCKEWELERYEKSLVDKYHRSAEDNFGHSYCSDCNESGIPSAPVPFSKRTESFSSLYSSSESLSSLQSRTDAVQPRSTHPSLSSQGKVEKPYPRTSNALASSIGLCKVVSPAQSTPNLHCKEEMISRPPSKKSVYEELACKSGFDFSPVVQKQLFWSQKQAFEREEMRESRLAFWTPGSRKTANQEPISLPAYCDKIQTCETNRGYYESVDVSRIADCKQYPNTSPNSPPPIPIRDSSSRYRGNTTHEKFPSWPASLPLETPSENVPQSSGYRSNSWTEQTRCANAKNPSYSRPDTHFQISTQQLPPVQEKTKKIGRQNSAKGEPIGDYALQKFSHKKSFSGDDAFNLLADRSMFECIYQNSKERFYFQEKHCDTYSPPERDVTSPSENSMQMENFSYKQVHEKDLPEIPETWGIYENLKVSADNSVNNTSTPLLDRLRLERENLPVSWSQRQDADTISDAGTCVSSNSSSQETLKWHGSYNDLLSIGELPRNASPSIDSDTSTLYEELRPGSLSGSEKSYSTSYNSLSDIGPEDCSKENKWRRFSAVPYHRSSTANNVSGDSTDKDTFTIEPKNFDHSTRRINAQRDVSEERNCIVNSSKASSPSYYSRINSNETRENRRAPPHFSKCSEQNIGQRNLKSDINFKEEPATRFQEFNSNISNKSPSQKPNGRYFSRSASITSNSYSKELKAIQKEAVLSFYRRQTAVVSKDSADRKTPRSLSFSYTRDCSVKNESVAQTIQTPTQRKRSLSSNSFSQQIPNSQHLSASDSAQITVSLDGEKQNITSAFISATPPLPEVRDRKLTPPVDSMKTVCEVGENQSERYSKNQLQGADFATVQNQDSESHRSLKIPTTARKAYLKKTSKSRENIEVKIVTPQEVALEKCKEEKKVFRNYPNPKPKIPPKRISKPTVVPQHKPKQQQATNACIVMQSSDDAVNQELQEIESNAAKDVSTATSEMKARSPDLPLPPPPPVSAEPDGFLIDDPFPPPPDLKDFPYEESETKPEFQSLSYSKKSTPSQNTFEPPFLHKPPDVSITIQHMEVVLDDTSPEWTDQLVSSKNSSRPLYLESHVPKQNLNTAKKIQSQRDSEAVYVNLDFQNRKYANDAFTTQSPVKVTNSATQTSDATPSLQRKASSFLKSSGSVESYQNDVTTPDECVTKQHKSFQNFDHRNLSENGVPIQNVMLDDNVECRKATNHSSAHGSSTSAGRDGIGLPLTNPYFTTSEPKAKLLTRYCRTWDNQWPDQLELNGQKEELIASISTKLHILRLEQIELKEEMKQNEELGQEVTAKIERMAKPNEIQKYRIHVEELEKIINLLLSLSGRLARAENALLILPDDVKPEEKNILEAKRNKLNQQHDEAWHLKENIDRRSSQVSLFLHHYLSKEEYADYEHFIKMKSKLLMDAREIDEKIRLGEEQLAALQGTFQTTHQNVESNIKLSGELTVLVKT